MKIETYIDTDDKVVLEAIRKKVSLEFEKHNLVRRKNSRLLKDQFFKDDLLNFTDVQLVCRLKYYYTNLVFFPDEELIIRFKNLGLTDLELRWFISLEKILDEFQRIEDGSDIIICKDQALETISLYLDSKITFDLLNWVESRARRNGKILDTRYRLTKFMNRLGYGKGKILRPKNHGDVMLEQLIRCCNKIVPGFSEGYLKGEFNGDNVRFLAGLIENCFLIPKTFSQTEFLSKIFKLIELIVEDRQFHSEAEFDALETYLGITYKSYQAKVIKKIIYKK